MDRGEPSRHTIPGPAGILQRALRQRERGKGAAEDALPTQEFLQRALLAPEFDDSFGSTPWETITNYGYLDMECYSSVQAIKADAILTTRIPMVVCMVKSCRPNGLGDATLELKDPTDTIRGSIHRKAFSQGNFAGKISEGAVLVLGDVVMWKPEYNSNPILNITNNNVRLVVTKDGDVIASEVIPRNDTGSSTN